MSEGYVYYDTDLASSSGAHIEELQAALAEQGYQTQVTGTFDTETAQALDSYVTDNNLGDYNNALTELHNTGSLTDTFWATGATDIYVTGEAADALETDVYVTPEQANADATDIYVTDLDSDTYVTEANVSWPAQTDAGNDSDTYVTELGDPQPVPQAMGDPLAYGFQNPVGDRYRGEQEAGNSVWATATRNQTYYPDQQTASDEYGVALQDGRVVIPGELDADGNPVYMDTTDIATSAGLRGSQPERMIYTMDGQGDLRMADPNAEQASLAANQRFHHSSLAGGDSVSGAGEMKVREGVVESVSDKSGHYKPDLAMTSQVNERLAEGGVDTAQVTYELGNFDRPGVGDTRMTGTELGAYDRDGILADLRVRARGEAESAASSFWGTTWQYLPDERKEQEVQDRYLPLMAGIERLDDRALYAKAREVIEGRHDALRALLPEIRQAMGWREDPLGRHQWRWYDGSVWTASVSDNDVAGEDPEGATMLGGAGQEEPAQQEPVQDQAPTPPAQVLDPDAGYTED